jgi:hypothetical protein
MSDLSFFAPWMLLPGLAVTAAALVHKRYFFKPNSKASPLSQFMKVFCLYMLPGVVALFFAGLSAANLALQAGYPVPPLLGQLVFMACCFGFTALVIRNEVAALARGKRNDSHPGS